MKKHLSLSSYNNSNPSVITIGTFDGVHIGHKAILNRLINIAKDEQLESIILTFFPHPRMVLQKETKIKLINTIDEREELLREIGLEHLIIHPFTQEFSRLTALEFVRDILSNGLNLKKIIIGYDHRFGRNRTATIKDLKEFGKTFNFEVIEISAQQLNDVSVSSTKIRNALDLGNIETANNYLGYHFMLSGTIVKGKGIGKTLDFPTANLQIEEEYKLIPKNGVYIVRSEIFGRTIFGLTNIGTNPTVGGKSKTIETYFLDFYADLYNKSIRLEFLARVRDEEKFNSIEALKEAIHNDVNVARNFIAKNE